MNLAASSSDEQWWRDWERVCVRGERYLIDVVIHWGQGRKLCDDDNAKAMLKGMIDGIADALWDGQDGHVEIGTVRQVLDGGQGWMDVTIHGG